MYQVVHWICSPAEQMLKGFNNSMIENRYSNKQELNEKHQVVDESTFHNLDWRAALYKSSIN